ncbi:MAG: MFS transporter [Alphaproteobacteria bacterium]|nr:MFS transporter [Alphaproteobacteria bacterium]
MSINMPTLPRDPTRRAVILLNGVIICRSMVFLVPVIVPYFALRIGLDFQEFLAAEAIFAAAVLGFEVPSGWLADVWQRKWVIILGTLISALGVGLFIPARDFADAAVAQVLMGMGIAMFSGADSALLFDTLRLHGQEGRYHKIESRRHGFGLYAVALSSIIGAWLFSIDPALPIAAMVIAYLATAVCAWFLVEPERDATAMKWQRPQLRVLLSANRIIIIAILSGAVLFAATSVAMWSQQPYYSALNIGTEWFGLLMAAGYVSGGVAGQFGHHLTRRLGSVHAQWLIWTALVLSFSVAGLWPGYSGVALLLCGSAAWGLGWPLVQAIINHRVGSARRATVLSMAGAAVRLGFIPLSAVIGWMSMENDIALAIFGLAVMLFLLGGPVLWWLNRAMKDSAIPSTSITARSG